MSNDTPIQPSLDDIRDVLHLAFMLLSNSPSLDNVLGTLKTAGGVTPLVDAATPPEWQAANRFVLDALIDGMAEALRPDADAR